MIMQYQKISQLILELLVCHLFLAFLGFHPDRLCRLLQGYQKYHDLLEVQRAQWDQPLPTIN